MRVHDAYKLFMHYGRLERRYADETLAKYADSMKVWALPFLGAMNVEDVTLQDVMEIRARMREKNLSVSREYQIVMTLKLFLKFARTVLQIECLDPGLLKLPRREAPKVEFLSNEEVERMIEAIPAHTYTGKRMRALVELLLATGLRLGEALALTRDTFDRKEQELEIIGKGKKRRRVFFTPRAMYWVGRYLSARYDREPWVFVTTGDPPRRLQRADISKMFIRLRQDAQIEKHLTPHLLRHTFCTNLLFNGADIRFIKDLAGHADIATTSRYYLGTDDKVLREVVKTKLDYSIKKAA